MNILCFHKKLFCNGTKFYDWVPNSDFYIIFPFEIADKEGQVLILGGTIYDQRKMIIKNTINNFSCSKIKVAGILS